MNCGKIAILVALQPCPESKLPVSLRNPIVFAALMVLFLSISGSQQEAHAQPAGAKEAAGVEVEALKTAVSAGKYREALKHARKAILLDQRNMTAHYFRGVAHQKLGEYISAEGEFMVVSQYGEGKLKDDAKKALSDLSKVKRKPTVLDFYTDWCVPCKEIAPFIKEAEDKYGKKVCFERMDGMTPGVRILFDTYKVDGFPVVILLNSKKKQVDRLDGKQSREVILSAIAAIAK